MLRYAITDSKRLGESFAERKTGLLAQAKRLALDGIDYIQLREKDLEAGQLFELAEALLRVIRSEGSATRLLLNARADLAAAANAHGVHLTSHPEELTPEQVREIFATSQAAFPPVVSKSCHSLEEVARAKTTGADLILFGPVFQKRLGEEEVLAGVGLSILRKACDTAAGVPVLALGGITPALTAASIEAGAAGVAGIRLFGGGWHRCLL